MKISIRNLWALVCTLALLGTQVLPAYTWADAVSPTAASSALPVAGIGKVTYLLGQADVTKADGSVSPLALQMDIPDGSRIHVEKRSRVSLLMVDGGIEKLGSDTVFTFNKYTYDPNDPQATEIRKTLQDGEVTSTTGRGGEVAKERYRLNSPLAAISVLGTEYTVKVSNGETWVTVHSGEISIAKLGGSCQRSGLGACAGGERLSEGQHGLALVVRANEPRPILMPATAIPTSTTKVETPQPVKEAEKESSKELPKESSKESAKSEQTASTEKPAEPESQKSTPVATPAASAAPAAPTSAATTAPQQIAEKVTSSPEPKTTEKASLSVSSPLAPVTVQPTVAEDERNPLFTLSNPESTSSVLTTPDVAVASPQTSTESSTPVIKAKQSLVQSSSPSPATSTASVSTTAKVSSVVTTTPVVEAVVPVKAAVVEAVVPVKAAVVEPVVPVKAVATPVAMPTVPVVVTPVVDSIPDTKPTTTVAAVTTPVVDKPIVTNLTVITPAVATPAIVVEAPTPTVNWGKYDPAASVDGKTSFSDQVSSSYTQLLQPVSASTPPTPILQQNPSVSPPEPDKKGDVGVAVVDSAVAPVSVATPVAATVSNADVGKTTLLPSSSASSTTTLRNDVVTPQTPSVTATPVTAAASVSIATPVTVAPLPAAAPLTVAPLTPLTPLTLTSPLVKP